MTTSDQILDLPEIKLNVYIWKQQLSKNTSFIYLGAANPQGSQNAKICFKWSDLSPDEKKLRGAGQVQVRGAHLRQKRFLLENTCFVDPEILWSYSALMWKQTGHKHWRGEDESFLHKGVLSEEASWDEGALWKSYPQTVGSRLMVPRVDSPENHYEDSWMSTPPLMKNAKVRL